MGAYHGKFGFDEFSHRRTIFYRTTVGRAHGASPHASPHVARPGGESGELRDEARAPCVFGPLTPGHPTLSQALPGIALFPVALFPVANQFPAMVNPFVVQAYVKGLLKVPAWVKLLFKGMLGLLLAWLAFPYAEPYVRTLYK